jgi:hypothetical protein
MQLRFKQKQSNAVATIVAAVCLMPAEMPSSPHSSSQKQKGGSCHSHHTTLRECWLSTPLFLAL